MLNYWLFVSFLFIMLAVIMFLFLARKSKVIHNNDYYYYQECVQAFYEILKFHEEARNLFQKEKIKLGEEKAIKNYSKNLEIVNSSLGILQKKIDLSLKKGTCKFSEKLNNLILNLETKLKSV